MDQTARHAEIERQKKLRYAATAAKEQAEAEWPGLLPYLRFAARLLWKEKKLLAAGVVLFPVWVLYDVIDDGRTGYRVARQIGIVLALAAALYCLHPPPKVAWFDTPLVAHEFNARGWAGGLEWYRDYHNFRRPVRAIEWDLMAHLFGETPQAYHAVNVLAVATCAGLLASLLGPIASLAWLGSYVTIYPILHFPLALNFALGLSGFSLILTGHGPIAGRRSPPWPTLCGVALIWMSALGHEIFLVFAFLPYLYSGWVRALPQGGIWGAMLTLPLWWLTRGEGGGMTYDAPVLEHLGRVAFSILSLGAAPEILREVGWPEPYARVRDIMLTYSGQWVASAMIIPAFLLIYAGLSRRWNGRLKFRVAWAALASLPLMLPVGTPESYHLIGAVAPMAAICEAGWRRAKWLIILVPLIALPHLAARYQLFYWDLPLMSGLAKGLREAYPHGGPTESDYPIQVGGHYAFLPRIPEPICIREPLWLWDAQWSTPDDARGGKLLTAHPTGGSIPLCR